MLLYDLNRSFIKYRNRILYLKDEPGKVRYL